jgi:hypothetical protein
MVKLKISSQPNRIKVESFGLGLVWLSTFFIKDFWLKGVFGKHAFMSILTVLFKEK